VSPLGPVGGVSPVDCGECGQYWCGPWRYGRGDGNGDRSQLALLDPPVYAPAACPALLVVLPGHGAGLQMADAGAVRLCVGGLSRASRVACGGAGDGRAAYRMVERVSGDVGGHPRHHDLAVSLFLASLARSRARAGAGTAARRPRCEVAGGADGRPYRHVVLQRCDVFHYPDHSRDVACARAPRDHHGTGSSGRIASPRRSRGVSALHPRSDRHRHVVAVPVLAGSAAYAVAEAQAWRSALDDHPRLAPGFYGVIAVAMLIGLALDYVGFNAVQMLFWSAVLNGVLAPPLIVLVVLLTSHPALMGTA